MLVLLRGDGGEQPRLGRGLNLRAGHHDHRHHRRQHAAERAAHDEERDERRGQEAIGHLGERRQLSLGHRAERDDGHQDIDHGHDHWGEQDGEGDVAARVLHVIGDLGDGRAAGERG